MSADRKVGIAALGAAAVISIGIGATVIGTGGGSPPVPPAPIVTAATHLSTDLLSAPIDPGDAANAIVVFPPGATIVPGIALSGSAIGKFQITGTNLADVPDGVMLSVWARNTSHEVVRFTANVQYDVKPASSP